MSLNRLAAVISRRLIKIDYQSGFTHTQRRNSANGNDRYQVLPTHDHMVAAKILIK